MEMNEALGQVYAQALLAIARVDREISPEESSRVRELVAARSTVTVDFEASFFEKMTPERLANEVPKPDHVTFAQLLIADGVSLATVDGDLNSAEANAILRFARTLGCSAFEISSVTRQLDEYLNR